MTNEQSQQKRPQSSERKIEANRLNARKSCGPKTATGKGQSSRNAIKYGFYSHGVVLETENPQDYDALREHVWNKFRPRNPLEEICVRDIVDTQWRLQRLSQVEATVFTRRSISFTGHQQGPGFAFVNDSQGLQTFSSLARVDAMLTRRLHRGLEQLRRLRKEDWPEPGPQTEADPEMTGTGTAAPDATHKSDTSVGSKLTQAEKFEAQHPSLTQNSIGAMIPPASPTGAAAGQQPSTVQQSKPRVTGN